MPLKSPCGGDAYAPALPGMRKPYILGPTWPNLCRYCAKNAEQFSAGKCAAMGDGCDAYALEPLP